MSTRKSVNREILLYFKNHNSTRMTVSLLYLFGGVSLLLSHNTMLMAVGNTNRHYWTGFNVMLLNDKVSFILNTLRKLGEYLQKI